MVIKRIMAVFTALLPVLVLSFNTCTNVYADSNANTVITLDDSSREFVVVEKDIDFINMEPAEEREGSVLITNSVDEKLDFYLSHQLLDNIADKGQNGGKYNIRIYKTDSNGARQLIFEDSVIKDYETSEDEVLLATLAKNESVSVDIVVSLDGESWDNSYMNKQGMLRLNISATQSGTDVPANQVVSISNIKTGDKAQTSLYVMEAILSGVLIILLVYMRLRKRKKDKANVLE